MDFTREPIIETVITPKEGCKLVVRSSKSTAQEEHFVDAIEVVSFGTALFFRSLERPKAFLVPVSDYEVLEVREARLVLKNVGVERTIKIGGGKAHKEAAHERPEPSAPQEVAATAASSETSAESAEAKGDMRNDRRRDKRRHGRKRRGRDEGGDDAEGSAEETATAGSEERKNGNGESTQAPAAPQPIPTIIPPPSTLISETIARYKDNALFKSAFYVKEEQTAGTTDAPQQGSELSGHPEDILEVLAMRDVSLEPSEYGSLGLAEEETTISWDVSQDNGQVDQQGDRPKRREASE